jgi:hypothetical protein
MSPVRNDIKNRTMKMKNKIFAMPAAAAAMPKKPKTAAIRATMKKISAQRNISTSLWLPRTTGAVFDSLARGLAISRRYANTDIALAEHRIPSTDRTAFSWHLLQTSWPVQ